MKIYYYEMLLRPFSPGAQPSGVVAHNSDLGRWGVIGYTRELTEKEISDYELKKWEESES